MEYLYTYNCTFYKKIYELSFKLKLALVRKTNYDFFFFFFDSKNKNPLLPLLFIILSIKQ